MQAHANEAMHDGGSRGWSPWCTCKIFGHGMWPTQEPPRRFQTIYFGWRFICRFLEFGLVYVGYFWKTFIIFTKYNHEIYFRSNCLGWLHVKGLSSWWISSKIQFCLVCVCFFMVCSIVVIYIYIYMNTSYIVVAWWHICKLCQIKSHIMLVHCHFCWLNHPNDVA